MFFTVTQNLQPIMSILPLDPRAILGTSELWREKEGLMLLHAGGMKLLLSHSYKAGTERRFSGRGALMFELCTNKTCHVHNGKADAPLVYPTT